MIGGPQWHQQARRVRMACLVRPGPILQQQAFNSFETLVNGIYLLLAICEAWLARTESERETTKTRTDDVWPGQVCVLSRSDMHPLPRFLGLLPNPSEGTSMPGQATRRARQLPIAANLLSSFSSSSRGMLGQACGPS